MAGVEFYLIASSFSNRFCYECSFTISLIMRPIITPSYILTEISSGSSTLLSEVLRPSLANAKFWSHLKTWVSTYNPI